MHMVTKVHKTVNKLVLRVCRHPGQFPNIRDNSRTRPYSNILSTRYAETIKLGTSTIWQIFTHQPD